MTLITWLSYWGLAYWGLAGKVDGVTCYFIKISWGRG